MRKSTLILSLALIAILSIGAVTTYNFYAPLVPGSNGQLLTSAGTNGNPTWLASGTAGQVLVSGGANTAPTWQGFTRATGTMKDGATGSVICFKCGKVCIVYLGGINVPGSSTTVTQDIATLPDEFTAYEFICATVMTNYGNNPSLVSVSGNTLKFWGAVPKVSYYGSIVFCTK